MADVNHRLIFPLDLEGNAKDRVIIEFRCLPDRNNPNANVVIQFPCPTNLLVQDNGKYAEVNLGNLVNSALSNNAVSAAGGGGKKATINGVGNSLIDALKTSFRGATGFDLARTVLGKRGEMITEDPQGSLSFAARAVKNPRTNTSFDSNIIRSFEYAFSCVARSAKESIRIKNINQQFRRLLYATPFGPGSSLENLSLAYPPIWEIRFIKLGEPGEVSFIPKIYKCYLESFNSTLNPGSNSWHDDGAPFQVDMSLTFREVRVLTRNDIIELEKDNPNRNYLEGDGIEFFSKELQPIATAILESYDSATTKAATNPNQILNARGLQNP